jgi:hypothetical protein
MELYYQGPKLKLENKKVFSLIHVTYVVAYYRKYLKKNIGIPDQCLKNLYEFHQKCCHLSRIPEMSWEWGQLNS